MKSSEIAATLSRLREGNERFVSHGRSTFLLTATERSEQALRQDPCAIILGCSDARVPAELIFDQGPGDLFVIRVAGNIVAPSQIGSVEFAAVKFGTPLVVVVGHTGCGAIAATLEFLRDPSSTGSRNLHSIIDRVRPSVESLSALSGEALAREAVRANVRWSVEQLRHGSEIIEGLMQRGELRIVGAEYSLETGVVDFFESDT
jgi:carbonic anhydrase